MSKKLDTSLYIKQINNLDEFQPGDTVSVNLRIIEGDKERVQTFDGNVISGRFITSKTPALGDTFTVRRISYGVGVERVLPFHSPNIESLRVTRKGKVRKSKLYYLRGLTGKKARIKEKRS
ncbi:MAG: 50S ribosomal protein L19 [Dehalococcoidia bacterium]|nr:50S ribosomal protein L19 [Dehalococcoidia bacterium]MQG09035.1 50S ribosomal protein L19 [SAR202 cluster bacterium]|tara:strand:- start:4089 stop:4451 length:363 start_codon:yes stop_codon:yes gene_type:complete